MTTASEDEVKLVDMSGPGADWAQRKPAAASLKDGMASNASLAKAGRETAAEIPGGDSSDGSRRRSPSRSTSRSHDVEAKTSPRPWRRLLDRWRRAPPVPEQRRPCPEYEAGIFSKLTFSWVSSLMTLGYRRTLKANDIYLISPARSVELHSGTAEAVYKACVANGTKNPLFWALYTTFKRDFWIAGLCRLAADLFTVASPYTLRYLIQFVQDCYISQFFPDRTAPPIEHGIGLLVGILVMQILQSFTNNHFLYRGSLVGGQMRAVLTTFVFEKSVRISGRARAGGKAAGDEGQEGQKDQPAEASAAKDEAAGLAKSKKEEGGEKMAKNEQGKKKDPAGWNTGRVINLQAMDAARIDSCVGMIHMVWTAPLVILICMALLIVNLGYSALAGFACVIFIMTVLIKTVQVLMRRRASLNDYIDRRVGLIQETLQAIRLVKYLGWESSFLERLDKVRDEETAALQLYMTIRNVVTTLGQVLPVIAGMFAFLTWALTGHPISAAVVFSSMALFNCLRMPLNYLPVVLGLASEGWASLLRIQGYLAAEEVEKVEVDPQMDEAVVVRDASFTWEQTMQTGDASALGGKTGGDQTARQPFQLRDVELAVRRGELLAVIGGVASGKSSLLAALAGDMRRTAGSFVWGGSRALCTQTAWIQNATVRENILFGQDFDGDWYDQVIRACALDRDLDILAHGDATEIGERGINLSGGQKQRISLARAVYSRAEMLMLDDPLSAVDAYVGKHMFEQAICGLLAPCTRILVTHHAHLWPQCDRVLWLDEGRVVACDTYNNLMANHPAFADMVRAADAGRDDESDPEKEEEMQEEGEGAEESGSPLTKTKTPMKRLAPKHSMPLAQKLPPKDELMQAEEQEVSSIPWSVYRSYITSAKSPFLVLATLPLLCLAQGTNIMTGIWLASWSGDRYGLERDSYIAGYVAFAVSQPIFLYLFGLCAALWCTQASNTMVHRATHAVIHAPVSFFDSTPLGRIINRFSKDVDVMDFNLTEALRLFMISVAIILSIFILIIYYFHWFAAGLCGALVIVLLSGAYYRASGREIKRHESVLRSTVVARFSEGLSGVVCIRTYGREEAFKHRVRTAVDDMDSAANLGLAAQRWLGFRLDYVGIMLIMTAGVLTLVERRSQNPAISGMVLSYTLGAVQVLQFIVRQWADVENAMNGTERLHSYENRLPQETTDDAVAVDSAWPPHGEVVFDNIHMRYRPGQPEVLRGFSLHVAAGEHIGIVGRTGAGKSSLIAALFRTTELSRGRIVIDGVEAARVPLDGLRSNLAIVPQETTLFHGTVRSNLDPFSSYAEWALLDALSQADLASSLGLDDIIEEGGANLSLGQQQQLALARVLVRGNRIIVCDEATSNVDLQADDRLQATMAKAFKGRTVLTIAHRLRTILRYDRILVMDQGRIIELGTPTELYEGGGVFRGMCDKSNITKKDFI